MVLMEAFEGEESAEKKEGDAAADALADDVSKAKVEDEVEA
jgi:Ran-binding protein 1